MAGHIKATVCQTDGFGNPHIKQGPFRAASESLHAAGIDVKQAVSDADTLIVSTALRHASEGSGFYLMVPLCQTQRICLQHQTN